MTPRCAVPDCGQPSPHATICQTCADGLAHALAAIGGPDGLAYHLAISLTRQGVNGDRGPTRGGAAPLPYDPKVSRVSDHLANILWLWATALGMPLSDPWSHEEAYVVLPPMTVPAQWLAGHMHAVSRHSEAGTITAELRAAITSAWDACGHKPPQRVYAGPCPHCSTDLLSKPGHTHVTCGGCGTVHNIADRQAHMRDQLDDALVTAVYAAAIMPGVLPGTHVSEGTIRVWASRHQLEQRGVVPAKYGGQPQPLYRFRDIINRVMARDARAGLAA